MSSYSEYVKKVFAEDKERFFGEVKQLTNKYFTFNHIVDDDTIILITKNIITVKGNPVLVVGNNKAVYLKPWQIKSVHNYYDGFNADAVKLNRNYFKVYTFKNDFEGFSFDNDETFESLAEIAKSQNDEKIAFGHMH